MSSTAFYCLRNSGSYLVNDRFSNHAKSLIYTPHFALFLQPGTIHMSLFFRYVASALLFLLSFPVFAQERVAYTSVQEAGPDYLVQGEYRGAVRFVGLLRSSCGLQVIARGEGDFTAILIPGGLAGQGGNLEEKVQLKGQTNDAGVTVLSNDTYQVKIANGIATVSNSEDRRIGRLRHIVRQSVTIGMPAPEQAVVLFDGQNTDNLIDAKVTEDGLLMEGVLTREVVKDFRLHLEFKTPFMPNSLGQSRGNSGVYIQRRYEVQVLDSFGLEGLHNECGGLYRQKPPTVNMAFPPLVWQTYDIQFRAARFNEAGEKTENAQITVYHNGIPVHEAYELTGKTGAGQPETPTRQPILLQNHSDPVRYRNIWLVHLEESEAGLEAKPRKRSGNK
ncbi:MAG: hypothetical protein CMJ76_07155 [Planctomycetaceae bacterium]|nr:hypothetical protein [Planctomycetaceae bacterium]